MDPKILNFIIPNCNTYCFNFSLLFKNVKTVLAHKLYKKKKKDDEPNLACEMPTPEIEHSRHF